MASVCTSSPRPATTFEEGSMKDTNMKAQMDSCRIPAHLIKELEKVYNTADKHDKIKCLELIRAARFRDLKKHVTSLRQANTAKPAQDYQKVLDSFQTSYKRDYSNKAGGQTWAVRPMTSLGHMTSGFRPLGPTVYDAEFYQKFQRPASPERAGTASGYRNNKPHPPQSFLIWKFPSKQRQNQDGGENLSEELTNEKLRQITKRLCHSVYQNDYLGIPQGFQVNSAFNLPPYWKDNVLYGMGSSQRGTFQWPPLQKELTISTTRYGSNMQKYMPAVAAIPTANRHMNTVSQTTYDRHYNDNAGPIMEHIRNSDHNRLPGTCRQKWLVSPEGGLEHVELQPEKFEDSLHGMSHSHDQKKSVYISY